LLRTRFLPRINIAGLTIRFKRVACLIALYIQHELSFDKFQANGDRLARVIMQYSFDGSSESNEGNFTSVRVAQFFRRPFRKWSLRIKMTNYSRVVRYGDKMFDEKNFMYADANFFDIFSFKLLNGNIHDALSRALRRLYLRINRKEVFWTMRPVNRMLRVGNDSNLYRVTVL
jgi:putative ABC transport system permease protein